MTHAAKDVMSLRLSISTAVVGAIAMIGWVWLGATWATEQEGTDKAQDTRVAAIEKSVQEIQVSQKAEAKAAQELRLSINTLVTELKVRGVVGKSDSR